MFHSYGEANVGSDSSVGIATRYGLDGQGIESQWGRDFTHRSRLALGPTEPPVKLALCLYFGINEAGAWRWSSTTFNAEVKERVYLYRYFLHELS